MAQQLLEYKVVVDTGTGKVSVDGLTQGFVNADVAAKKLNSTLSTANKNLGQTANKSGLAGAAVVEIGRTISDANYGMMAMANNISQLGTLLMTLIDTSKGVTKGFKALASAFMGPLGLIVIFQSVIAYLEKLDRDQKKAAQSANSMGKAYANAGTEYEILLEKRQKGEIQLTDAEVKNTKIRISALKAEALVRAQINEIQKLQSELLEIERTKAEDNLAWYEQFWISLKTGALGLKGITPTAEFLTELTTLGEEEKQKRIKALNKQIEEIAEAIDVDALKKLLEGKNEIGNVESDSKIKAIKSEIEQEELLALVYEKTSKNQSLGYAERQKANLSYGESLDIIYDKTAELNDLLIEEANLTGDSNKIKAAQIEKENALFEVNEKRSSQVSKIAELTQGEIDLQKSSLKSREEYTFALEELAILQIENEVERARALKELHDREALSEKQRLLDSINNTQEGTEARQKATDTYLTWYIERLKQAGADEAAIAEAVAKIRKQTTEDNDASYKESLGILQQSLDAVGMSLQGFSMLAEKDSKKQKQLAAAGATIDTLAAIVGVLKNAGKGPKGGIPGFAIAQAIATGIFGFAQVKKILATDPTSGSDTKMSSIPPSPTFNVVGSSGSSQLREAVERGMDKPVKAYVTQKDINSSAELDRNTRKSATIV